MRNDEQAWQQACKENTIMSYQAYLNNDDMPKKYAKIAQYRIQVLKNEADDQAWDEACQENTIKVYKAYLEGDTLKKYATEADKKAWQQACDKNTVASYQAYLNGNTPKEYADDAQKRLEEAEIRLEDEETWQWTYQQNTKAAYQAYLDGDTLKNYAYYAQNILQGYRCYIDNGDGTVTDTRTGLVWLEDANCFGLQDWEDAIEIAAELAHGQCGLSDGSKAGDWRLPTKYEWEAMVDEKYEVPALSNAAGTNQWQEGDAFSGVQQTDSYWSSEWYHEEDEDEDEDEDDNSYEGMDIGLYDEECDEDEDDSYDYDEDEYWQVALSNGNMDYYDKTYTAYVWPVRDKL